MKKAKRRSHPPKKVPDPRHLDGLEKYALKKWVFILILFTIGVGLLIPYAGEMVCVLWFPDKAVGLGTWNQFVSIVLGIVATVLSIVSLIMGFKNYDDTLSLQDKYTTTFDTMQNIAYDVKSVKSDLHSSLQKSSILQEMDGIGSGRHWDKKNDEE